LRIPESAIRRYRFSENNMDKIRIFMLATNVRAPYTKWRIAKSFLHPLNQESSITSTAILQRSYGQWNENYAYVVVDPNDPTLMLSLTQHQYVSLLQVIIRQRETLKVILTPDDHRYPTRDKE
ncbi:28590_t:CDS:2, partial [Racocetra persica]